ncbi:MAG TPA: CBS domain-containing protein [Gammaproteobacteria bacterium]|nr:CBS domain-containing protein [Gammaproteobacteria bacterium]
MRVEELMSRQVYWCRPESTLDKAAQLMWDHDVGAIPVCSGDGTTRVIGIITDRDIAMCALFRGRPLHEIQVSEGMTQNLRKARPADSASAVEQEMRNAQIRRLPVIDDNEALIGIVSLADLSRQAARSISQGTRDVSHGEVGDTLAAIVEPTHRSSSSSAGASSSGPSSAQRPYAQQGSSSSSTRPSL